MQDLECQGPNMKAVHMKGIAQLFELVGQKVLANISTSLYGWIFVQLVSRSYHNPLIRHGY